MKTNENDGAFGFMFENFQQPGLTKREYFASMAMQGLLVNAGRNQLSLDRVPELVNKSVVFSDALIEALNKQ